jgi:hypothetical protein
VRFWDSSSGSPGEGALRPPAEPPVPTLRWLLAVATCPAWEMDAMARGFGSR